MSSGAAVEKPNAAEAPSPKRQKQQTQGQQNQSQGQGGAHASPMRSATQPPPPQAQPHMNSPYGPHGGYGPPGPGPVGYPGPHPSYHHYPQVPPPHHLMGGYGHPPPPHGGHYPPPGHGGRWPPQQGPGGAPPPGPPPPGAGGNQGGIFRQQDRYAYGGPTHSPTRGPPPPGYGAHPPPQSHRPGPPGGPVPGYGVYGAMPPYAGGPPPDPGGPPPPHSSHYPGSGGTPPPPGGFSSPGRPPSSRPQSSTFQSPVRSGGGPSEQGKDANSEMGSPDGKAGADDKDSKDKDKGRGKYVCGKCGAPKKGHNCPYQPKLKRRPDEPLPEMKNAAAQVEMDELMVIRRLNLEIQGLPQSYVDESTTMQDSNVDADSYTYDAGPYAPPPAGPDKITVRSGGGAALNEQSENASVDMGSGPGPGRETVGGAYPHSDSQSHHSRQAPTSAPGGPSQYDQRHPQHPENTHHHSPSRSRGGYHEGDDGGRPGPPPSMRHEMASGPGPGGSGHSVASGYHEGDDGGRPGPPPSMRHEMASGPGPGGPGHSVSPGRGPGGPGHRVASVPGSGGPSMGHSIASGPGP